MVTFLQFFNGNLPVTHFRGSLTNVSRSKPQVFETSIERITIRTPDHLLDFEYSFQNPLRQAYRQKKVLSEYLELHESAIHTVINAGCIVVKYAYEVMESNSMPPTIIGETFDNRDIPIGIESVIKTNLVDEVWIERVISYLMLNYKSNDPNALGKPIKREELMSFT